jgi:hypothetical protein
MGPKTGKNIRGFDVNGGRKKKGPADPESSRRTPLQKAVNRAEATVAHLVRNSVEGLNGDQICAHFVRECKREGAKKYYAVRHGVGSSAMRSWRWKFEERWGLRNYVVNLLHASRKSNQSIYNNIMGSWQKFDEVVEAAVASGGDRRYIHIVNMDETGLRAARGITLFL